MNCQQIIEQMPDFVDGQLRGESLDAFRAHLENCLACARQAQQARAFSASLGTKIKGHAQSIHPPAGAKEALLREARAASPAVQMRVSIRRYYAAAAAAVFAVALLSGWLWMRVKDGSAADAEIARLQQRIEQLSQLKEWQEQLAQTVQNNPADRPLAMVASAYLPRERSQSLLRRCGLEPSEDALESAWPESKELVVRLQRSGRSGGRAYELLFEQWSDGRVHVEHTEKKDDGETVTKLDAGSWEILAAQNSELCRQLEIVDARGKLIAGLPIPSASNLKRDAVLAAIGESAPAALMKRLAELRLSTRVKSSAEMEQRLREAGVASVQVLAPRKAPLKQLQREVRALEETTAAATLPPDALTQPAYFRVLKQL
ncbi:MAG TPA: zf-HC2 domain-containing protein [Planctomycetota bacterium]|jgi:hypothetical protein